MNECPQCQSSRVVKCAGPAEFRPECIMLRSFRRAPESGLFIQEVFQTCLDCGLLWSRLSVDELLRCLREWADEETKAGLKISD